jgi:formylglycine-generating enzyme required for sulfatase activity
MKKCPNNFPLYDMFGNVSEWVNDRYEPYEPKTEVDPVGTEDGESRVRRGPSVSNFRKSIRASKRDHSSEDLRPLAMVSDAYGLGHADEFLALEIL